jgi:hypothetical protein
MENLEFNNPSNLEKPVEDTTEKELTAAEQKEAATREKITIEVEGQSIEGEKYYFDYPEYIQKETGILGYERIKIIDEKFTNLKELGWEKVSEIIENTLLKLSNGEYPNKCVTHIIGADADQDSRKKYLEYFRDDKFFLQKIYDLERIKKEIESSADPKWVFNHGGGALKVFDKKTDQEVSFSHVEIGQITSGELLEKDSYVVKPFNLAPGRFWDYLEGNDLAIGFSVFDDLFFKKYLESSVSILLQHRLETLNNLDNDDIKDMFCIYLVNEYNRLGFSFGDPSNDEGANENLKADFIFEINKIAKDFLKEKKLLSDQNLDIDVKMGEYTIRRLFGRSYSFKMNRFHNVSSKIDVSILINHDEIPQLSWGHAKYAHYFNDKSFNFFKFKHADHLPSKE